MALPVYAYVLSGFFSLLTQSNSMHVRLIGVYTLCLRVTCASVRVWCLCVALQWTCKLSRITPPLTQYLLGIGITQPNAIISGYHWSMDVFFHNIIYFDAWIWWHFFPFLDYLFFCVVWLHRQVLPMCSIRTFVKSAEEL